MEVRLNGRLVQRDFNDFDTAIVEMENILLQQGEYFTIIHNNLKYYIILDPTNNSLSDNHGFVKFKEEI